MTIRVSIRLLIITLFAVLCCPRSGNTKAIKVCPNCPTNNLEDAISSSSDGDTIFIHSGTYIVENIPVENEVAIIGVNNPVLESKSGDEILTVLANCVTISGLVLQNVTTSYLKERSAIRIKKHKYFDIEGNTIIDCFFSIYIEHSRYGNISNNTILGNATTEAESGNGIHAWYSKDINIYNNRIEGQRDGIYFEFVNNSIIKDNVSQKNKRYGLHFMFSNNNEYHQNIFKDNGVGVAVMFSRDIIMTKNEFSHNWGRASYGLLLKEINDANIDDNVFEQNTTGIFVEGSNRISYNKNQFMENGWAMKFSGGCSDNTFTKNNLYRNSIDLVVSSNLTGIQIENNYWGKYTGYDLDNNGIGDIPYYPVKLFSYILEQCPETIVLMRSLFVDIINFSERVSPVFTPKDVFDPLPQMEMIK